MESFLDVLKEYEFTKKVVCIFLKNGLRFYGYINKIDEESGSVTLLNDRTENKSVLLLSDISGVSGTRSSSSDENSPYINLDNKSGVKNGTRKGD